MKKGIQAMPQFRRIKIETVGLSFLQKTLAAFKRPRIELTRTLLVPLPCGKTIMIPSGFDSDGGSVPLFALWFAGLVGALAGGWWLIVSMAVLLIGIVLNPFGLMLVAFLVHDYAVRYGCLLLDDGDVLWVDSVWQANRLMRRVNFMVNDMILLGLIAHAGVTLGAWWSWRKWAPVRAIKCRRLRD